MKLDYTDAELVELADWAEEQERSESGADWKRAYGAIRQGADWLMRARTKRRQRELEDAGKSTKKLSATQ